MFVVVLIRLGGIDSIFTLWENLPAENSQAFHEPYGVGFALAFLFINFLAYNGGQWNLATRYISSPDEQQASKAARLSGLLYLIWPLILFFPMWAAPVLLPGLDDPSQSYGELTLLLLPSGLVGLVIASLFANTMSMTSSDANTISAVITRDILPNLSEKFKNLKRNQSLLLARGSTFVFTALTLVVAIYADTFGGVLGLIITWFGALVGPIAIPMILGLLPMFRHSDSKAAIISIIGGLAGFVVANYVLDVSQAIQVLTPIGVSLILFTSIGWWSRHKKVNGEVNDLLEKLNVDL
jgi:solute:Na+ symporter, SSS family